MTAKEIRMRCSLLVAAALAIAGCDRSKPSPEQSPAAQATPTEPVSIIREDIEVPRETPPLAPLEVRIAFPEGGAELSPAAATALARVMQSAQLKAGGAITLRGHSDSSGSDAANLRASKARADAVRDWLVERGVDPARVRVIALGEQNPIRPNALPDGSEDIEGRAANRRVDVHVAVPQAQPEAQPTREADTLVDELTGGEG